MNLTQMSEDFDKKFPKELYVISPQQRHAIKTWVDKHITKLLDSLRVEELTREHHNITKMELAIMGEESIRNRVAIHNDLAREINKKLDEAKL